MRRRSLITFLVLNILVTLAVIFIVLQLNPPQQTTVQTVITVPVLVTATTDPNATPLIRIITTTPLPGFVAGLPTDVLDTTPEGTPGAPLPTLDAQAISGALSGDTALQTTATALPQNCILHVIAEGDTPFAVAEQYGADGFNLMEVNGLNDETASQLQIGDVLIVPLEGCPLTAADVAPAEEPTTEGVEAAAAEATGEATAESTAEATPRATLTLPPTAANAQISIVDVIGVGDVTTEGVVIRNNGNTVNVRGWTLSDADGNTYTFTERALFSNAQVTVFSRVGQDTAIALFWNRNQATFAPGDTLTLKDANGGVQATYRVPNPVSLG